METIAADELSIPWTTLATFDPSRLEDLQEFSPVALPIQIPERPQGLVGRALRLFSLRSAFFRWLAAVQYQYDAILLRYTVYDVHLLRFASSARVPVFTVHHTFELEELASQRSLDNHLKTRAERFIGRRVLRQCTGIIAMTDEIARYELERAGETDLTYFVYPNGGPEGIEPVDRHISTRPEIIFLASFFEPWHGLDLLLDSVAMSSQDFKLHIVGEVSSSDRNRAMGDQRVIIHGSLMPDQIRTVARSCWLGIASLALDRNGMRQACALKVREYLAMGLPAYGSYEEVLPSNFPYYVQGPPSIDGALQAARAFSQVSAREVADVSQPLISKKQLLGDLYSYITAAVDGRDDCD